MKAESLAPQAGWASLLQLPEMQSDQVSYDTAALSKATH